MSRLSDTNRAQTEAAHQVRVHLVELELDAPTGVIRMAAGPRDIVWDGEVYTRGGHLLGFTDIEESAGLLVTSCSVALSGVDGSMLALVLQEKYLHRPLRILRGWLGDDGELVGAPALLFDGRVNQPTIQLNKEDGTATVALSASNAWVVFEHSPGRTTNHEQQQVLFPGDMGFQFAGELYNELPWGVD